MITNHIVSMATIAQFFSDNLSVLAKGETAARKSNRVAKFNYDAGTRMVFGVVDPSMKKQKYKVAIYLDEQFTIERATCECPNGQHRCSHIAALGK